MFLKFTKKNSLLIVAMLLVFCALTNNVMAWEGNGTAGNPWKIGDSQTNTATAVTAVLSENTLTISGSGNMADFWHSIEGEAPWWFNATNRNSITTVIIQSGITNIGDRAFKDCSSLQWITIPEGVGIIGAQTFENCISLTAFHIPSSVATIESQAFKGCNALTTIWNRATTPQTIDASVFEGVSLNDKYLAVAAETIDAYKAKNVWGNFTVASQSILIKLDDNDEFDAVAFDLDGHLQYYKFQDNNPNLLEKIVVFDRKTYISEIEIPSLVVDFNSEGNPYRYMAGDGSKMLIDGYANNTFNATLVTTSGETFFVENISYDTSDITNDFSIEKYTTAVAKKMKDATIHKLMEEGILNVEDIVIKAFINAFLDTVFEDDSMPDIIRVGYSLLTFVKDAKKAATACGWANAVAPTLFFAIPIPYLNFAVAAAAYIPCFYDIYKMAKETTKLAGSLYDMFNNTGNASCSVFADLTGGTLVISGNGALCIEEINKYTDRKTEIKKLVINSGVTSIPNKAFANYPNLKTVTISAGGTSPLSLDYYYSSDKCFSDSPIETLVLNRNISYRWGSNAPFSENAYLKSVTIGDDVTSIGSQCFYNCTGLQTVNLANSTITSIGSNAFANDSSVTTHFDFPSTLTTIGDNAFYACGLPEVIIPNSVTTIGNKAFQNCKNLKTVTISAGGTSPLSLDYYYSSDKCFSDSPIETLVLNRNISYSYGSNAPFSENTYLRSVTIGNDVTAISTSSFSGCIGLTQITSNAIIPPTLGSNAFYNVSKSIPIYINCNNLSAYQSAQYWSGFTNYRCAVQVVPESNSAVVTYPKIDNAATYKLSVYSDESHTNRVTEINLDANGKLKSASEQNALEAETTFSCSVSGLSANTRYYYSLTPYNASGNILTVFTGDFVTQNDNTLPGDDFVVINGVSWATRNVDAPGTFAANPQSAGKFYQWNRKTAWNATGSVSGWNNSTPLGVSWATANDPCPTGWRVPTQDEFQKLIDAGSDWTIQNGVNGRRFGSGNNTIFLPALGYRIDNGTLFDTGSIGHYWSGTQYGSNNAYYLGFHSNDAYMNNDRPRESGWCVRCVKENTSDINNIAVDQLKIFPNPVQNELFIKSDLLIEKVEIYSLTGELLILENNFDEKISVATLPKAIYVLKVYTDRGVSVSKIIKE